ncbi:hypothetical protein C0043_31170, partial [Pseudomonas aeruginosa]
QQLIRLRHPFILGTKAPARCADSKGKLLCNGASSGTHVPICAGSREGRRASASTRSGRPASAKTFGPC